MKAQFLHSLNVNLSQPQLNSTSTQFQLNFNSTLSKPHFNLGLKSTLAPISTTTNLNLNLNSIWLWHKSNPILFALWVSIDTESYLLVLSYLLIFKGIWSRKSERTYMMYFDTINTMCILIFLKTFHIFQNMCFCSIFLC